VIGQELLKTLRSIRNFLNTIHPVTTTLLMMLLVSVPVTLVSSAFQRGINKENQQFINEFFRDNKPKALAYDLIIKTPIKEEMKYRAPVFMLSLLKGYFKKLISFENPLVWLIIILPGISWSSTHVLPIAALIDNLFLGWLVFRIGGIRGWLAGLLVHMLVNTAVFIGFYINSLLK